MPDLGPPVRLFLDCAASYCDDEHVRREIPYVDHVRDRHDADLYLFVAGEGAGGAGGTRFTLAFQGQGRFQGMADTIRTVTPPEPTYDEGRSTLIGAIQMGLMRYVARTDPPGDIRIRYVRPSTVGADAAEGAGDPWHAWVFAVGVDGTADGEQRYRYLNMSGSLSANRTTEEWKIRVGARASRFEQRFEFEDGEEFVDRRTAYTVDGLVVSSLSGHWSAGATGRVQQSTRSNTDRDARVALALEANVFPYAESSHREFVFLWEVGAASVRYEDETIFGRTAESLLIHALTVRYNLQRPWGFVGLNVYGEAIAPGHDFSLADFVTLDGATTYDVALDGTVSVNLLRGLSFDVSGGYSRIGNQRSLPRGGATPEEVLLRRRELATNYRYTLTVGLSYTFGSIYNNVVNPRFR